MVSSPHFPFPFDGRFRLLLCTVNARCDDFHRIDGTPRVSNCLFPLRCIAVQGKEPEGKGNRPVFRSSWNDMSLDRVILMWQAVSRVGPVVPLPLKIKYKSLWRLAIICYICNDIDRRSLGVRIRTGLRICSPGSLYCASFKDDKLLCRMFFMV